MADLPDFDSLWDYDKPEETESKFRELLTAAERSQNAAYHAQLLSQIARAQGLQGKFAEAHGTLDTAERLLAVTRIYDSSPGLFIRGADGVIAPQVSAMSVRDLVRAKIRILLERGRVYNSASQPERARPLFLEAWELGQSAGHDFYAVDAAHMMAIIEPPEAQMEWNLKALALAERSPDARATNWRGSLYNNIGWTYHDGGEYDEALDCFQKALKFREEQGRAPEIRIARWCVARALRSLDRVEEALAMQRQSLAELERAGEKSGFVFEELAECLLLLKEPDEARPYFAKAYDELSKESSLVENEPARLKRLKELSSPNSFWRDK